MTSGITTVTVLEHCRVSPPLDHSVTEKLLHLTFFDIFWLNWPSVARVFFYDFPCSKSEFMQTIVPHLKKSLALTLKHYFPFCGNLITPTCLSNNTTPAIRYLNGDSISLIIAEFSGNTSHGFKHLSGDQDRDVDDLLALIPQLPPGYTNTTCEDDSTMCSPVLSVQVTLFPDQGFSIGFRNSHVIADGRSMSNFIRTWACINAKQLMGVDEYDNTYTIDLPFYDRSVIKDPKGIASIFLRECLQMASENSKAFPHVAQSKDLVQATFKMNRVQIQGLKNLVTAQYPYVSTFVVACAYVWTCMAKARMVLGLKMNDENEVENFIFMMDTRERLDPPIPLNYFGNAALNCRCSLKSIQLVGEKEGFLNAVEEIRRALDEKINNEEGVLKGFETIFDVIKASKGRRKFGVAGSPKFDYYSTDFGWGKPSKYEVVSEKFGLVGSRDSDGSLEIGLCFSKDEMDVFTTIFTQGLMS
ncbi:Anthocyanin 5-aromatic acyltransferase [Heracleum sosnowskyi]|uniref:Anthocyanin 5-aromatic acyltransferase n=1 Tax=Heracleum sosnowskyi TaxID=360622 RepID=A0AAD8MXQ6_9APIA|nr:Anthocyanin 5-aromatic acyltransferase [Heracleum sosnowskyi]